MAVYTRTGDNGETSLYGGIRVSKTSPIIHAIGTIDELNSSIGIARSFCTDKKIDTILEKIQNQLFNAQAQLAKGSNVRVDIPKIELKHIVEIEQIIDGYEKKLPKQSSFILPAGTKQATLLHLARTICRRAERIAFSAAVKGILPQYLNRVSTLLFILARASNKKDVGVKYE
ncbi:cob(I)yrinic acid a,c-diamide adenosyltransferase [Candidatus Woesearchaeota archaeon]|nr:cob(I)yrinic acid a,c-diamide adenosyltransferase [Candidatus Woesearchaeota archaeon]